MSDCSTPSTIDLTNFTVWDATNPSGLPVTEATCLQCRLTKPALSGTFNGRQIVIPRYSHNWWKDRFDTLALPLPFLDVNEVLEMTQDHFEQLPMGAVLVPGPVVTGQVEGDPLLNQILAVRACIQHLGDTLASVLEEKIQMAAAAASTMSQLEGPMSELEEALSNTRR
ncbi:hypothetical protein BDR03DRAFT_986902 [Suillus americanus]|nr:hypothetical protein BDR03DRAFT_986902 [Suillus americanus]